MAERKPRSKDHEGGSEEVMFISDVMRERKMGRQLVMEAIQSGDLPAEEYGKGKNKYRIDRADYEEWRQRHRVKAAG